MLSKVELLGHLAYKILNAPVAQWPFPHIFVPDVFPTDFYNELLLDLPADTNYETGKSNYKGRRFADPVESGPLSALATDDFTQIALRPFKHHLKQRFENSQLNPRTDLRLIRDGQGYSIGPHTDAPWKVLSFLFYLPYDYSLTEHGTSIYLPNDPSFRCAGGPHYPYDKFTKIVTAPYEPNSLFAFFKTDFSFHGVEPITIPCQRDLLLWNLYDNPSS